MKVKKLLEVDAKEFNDIYDKKIDKPKKEWKVLFRDSIKQLENFSASPSIWFVGDFIKGHIVEVGGECESASPLTKKEWLGLHPMEIGAMIHPLDVAKMKAYIVFIAGFLAQKEDSIRNKIKASIVFRMVDANQKYTWRMIDYPQMYYENNLPHYLLCRITEINHFVGQAKCALYIFDSSTADSTMYYCEEEQVELKLLNPQKALSSRELEVLQLLTKGLLSKEIADVLKISKNTVENHKQNIYAKTGTKKATELVSYANNFIFNNSASDK